MPTYLQGQTLIRWDGWDIECTMLKALGTKVHHLNGGCQTPEQHVYTNSWIIHSCAGRLLQKLLVLNTFIGLVQCGIWKKKHLRSHRDIQHLPMSGCMGGYWYWLSEWKVSAPRFLHRGNRQHLFGGRVFVIVLSKGSTVLEHHYIIIHRQFLLSSLIVHCVGPVRIARISLNKRCWSTEFLAALNLKLHSKESPWRTNAQKRCFRHLQRHTVYGSILLTRRWHKVFWSSKRLHLQHSGLNK